MRLSKFDKETFVKHVMNALPTIKKVTTRSELQREMSHLLCRTYGIPSLVELSAIHPNLIREDWSKRVNVFNRVGDSNAAPNDYFHFSYPNDGLTFNSTDTEVVFGRLFAPIIAREHDAYGEYLARESLRDRVREVVFSCGTDKQLRAAFPDFDKLIPTYDRQPKKQLPLVSTATLTSDLIKAGLQLGAI